MTRQAISSRRMTLCPRNPNRRFREGIRACRRLRDIVWRCEVLQPLSPYTLAIGDVQVAGEYAVLRSSRRKKHAFALYLAASGNADQTVGAGRRLVRALARPGESLDQPGEPTLGHREHRCIALSGEPGSFGPSTRPIAGSPRTFSWEPLAWSGELHSRSPESTVSHVPTAPAARAASKRRVPQ